MNFTIKISNTKGFFILIVFTSYFNIAYSQVFLEEIKINFDICGDKELAIFSYDTTKLHWSFDKRKLDSISVIASCNYTNDQNSFSGNFEAVIYNDSLVLRTGKVKVLNLNIKERELYLGYNNNRISYMSLKTPMFIETCGITDDKRDGEYIRYVLGNIAQEGQYKNGSRYGEWINYHENTRVASKGHYDSDVIIPMSSKDSDAIILLQGHSDTIDIVKNIDLEYLQEYYQYSRLIKVVYVTRLYRKKGIWKYFDLDGKLVREKKY